MNNEYIESLILRMCKQPRSYEYLSRNLFGFDLLDLSAFLRVLRKAKKIKQVNDLWVVYSYNNTEKSLSASLANEFLNQHIGFFNLYKKPHPLDFEWRNATTTINYLTDLVGNAAEPEDKILLLGMPTLFANFCVKHIPNHVTLIDNNKPVVVELQKKITDKRFKILEKNIFDITEKEAGKYTIVFMDPPWYSPHFYQFVWLAARCLETGGTLGISIPPVNTRPDINKERLNWLQFCLENGLALENLYAQKLQYAMPFFEYNAFKAAGLKDILPIWRKGDLALFRKIATVNEKRPILNEKIPEWNEFEFNGVRIRVNLNGSANGTELTIESVVEGDILPSVSSRDPRRDLANVWTSGNRIFKVSDAKKFVDSLSNKNSQKNENVNNFVATITNLETNEYNVYLEWLYNEMERQID